MAPVKSCEPTMSYGLAGEGLSLRGEMRPRRRLTERGSKTVTGRGRKGKEDLDRIFFPLIVMGALSAKGTK